MTGTWRPSGGLDFDASLGIADALDLIGRDADARVPVDTGALRDSQVKAVDGNTGGIGYRDPKAVAAHENLQVRLNGGRQAKFLESAVNDNRVRALELIAADLRRQLRG